MAENPYLMNEEQVPDNWSPVDPSGQAPQNPSAPPAPNDMPQYFSGSLAPNLQHDGSFVGTEVGTPRIPKYSLMPFGNQSNPFTNAAASSTVEKVAPTIPSSGGGGGSSQVTLNIPAIFTPVTQTVTEPGPLAFTLATEAPGTYFSTPSSSLPNIENFVTGSQGFGASSSGTLTLSVSPTTATSWGIYAAAYNGTLTTPSGFTAFGGGSAHGTGFFSALSGTSPISIAQAVASNSTASGVFAVFAGSLPSIVQQAAATFTGVTPLTKAFTSNNTAGNTIIAIVTTANNTKGPFSLSVSDTAGNSYTTIGYVQGDGVWQPSVLIAIATNIAGSANTVRANITGTPAGGSSGQLQIIEYPALTAASNIPVFKPIISSDIPPINVGSSGNGGISGIVRPVNGGTGSDLSATGGTSLFLSQLSTGANISPTQPDFSDLAGILKATKYNNVALVSNGIPSEVATVDLTGQTAAKTTTTLYAVPTTAQYRLSWNAKVTTPDGASSTLGALTITYTDADNTVQMITAAAQNKNGTIETSDTGNSTTTVMLGLDMMLNARSGTNIQYAFAYASGTPGTMAYNLHIKLESL